MRAKFDPIYSVKVPPPQKTLHPGHQGFRYGPLSRQILTGNNMCFSNVKYSISSPERGDRKIASQGYGAVCAWFCVSWSVLPVSDWVCAVQCQHGTSGDCVQQQKGCTNRLQIRFARFGRHFGSARHGNADPGPAQGTSVHGVDSGWSGVCAWFCVILSVLPVSDWVCAVQCQHGTSGDCG